MTEHPADRDPMVSEFVRLSRQHLKGDPSRKAEATFARIQERLSERQRTYGRWQLAWFSAAAAAAIVLIFVGYKAFGPQRAITYQVVGAQVSQQGILVGNQDSRVQFSDGSLLTLDEGTQTRIGEVGPHGGLVHVDKGWAHLSIAKKPRANWAVQAGPYTVRVTGTAFDVRWSVAEQRFEIAMRHGSVTVTGPLAPKGVDLRAGERMIADRQLVVEKSNAPQAARMPEKPAQIEDELGVPRIVSPESLPTEPAEPSDVSAKKAETGRGTSWRDMVARGNFSAVLDEAQRRGIARTLASATLEDLSALADAARYARRTDIGREALLAQRQRFPGSRAGREAAFFLGSLYEGTPAAFQWYDRYLQENPRGAYVSQALGRKLVLVYEQHRIAEARQLADQYIAKYPNGPYASTARKVLAEAAKGSATPRPRR